ncbi:hypothetical protein [Gimesia alba]|uniref:hypothetical protein n=1 Tax=Gimesia alba TaxID=2527973 RepID=UPI0011A45DC1|nr:hypothetical protein [Gimesia alba]
MLDDYFQEDIYREDRALHSAHMNNFHESGKDFQPGGRGLKDKAQKMMARLARKDGRGDRFSS